MLGDRPQRCRCAPCLPDRKGKSEVVEYRAGGGGDAYASTRFALDLLLSDLLAALVRDDSEMIDRLTIRDRV